MDAGLPHPMTPRDPPEALAPIVRGGPEPAWHHRVALGAGWSMEPDPIVVPGSDAQNIDPKEQIRHEESGKLLAGLRQFWFSQGGMIRRHGHLSKPVCTGSGVVSASAEARRAIE